MTKNKTLIILGHGILCRNSGAGSIDLLGPELAHYGYDVIDFDYGWRGLFMAAFSNNSLAKKLSKLINKKRQQYRHVVYVGHSNGCAIGHISSYKPYRKVGQLDYVYIAAALDRDLEPNINNVNRVLVLHSDEDGALTAAGVLKKTMSFLHLKIESLPYGELGKKGYDEDTKIEHENIDYSERYFGHSDYFNKSNIKGIAKTIAMWIED